MLSVFPFGCDDKEEKEECKCDSCPCEQIRDAEPQADQEEPEADMGLDEEPQEDPEEEGGAEEEDLEAGDQDASDEDCECEGEDCC